MVLNSPFFLFAFLPVVLILFFIIPQKFKNFYLVAASIFFYTWGEGELVFMLILSIFINFIAGIIIDNYRNHPLSRITFICAIILNVAGLAVYKYTNFFADNLNSILASFGLNTITVAKIYFPLGISFYTFQAISYIIDIYHEEAPVEKNPVNAALYMTFFPKIISGPIIKYSDMKAQIDNPKRVDTNMLFEGLSRFITGLAKKVIIADSLGIFADQVFAANPGDLSAGTAWLGAFIFGLQLFFDFSGYTDMAIGIGKALGFSLPENFDYPYISQSISEFWRRWHQSLSFWFRDYFYTPLSFVLAKKWNPRFSIAFSVFIAFIVIGLWHGQAWKYVIFGFIHASFLVFEMTIGLSLLNKLWRPLRHAYTLLVIMISTLFFRADNVDHALAFMKQMFYNGFSVHSAHNISMEPLTITMAIIAAVFALPLFRWISLKIKEKIKPGIILKGIAGLGYVGLLVVILIFSLIFVASGQFSPFIYFQF